MAFKHRISFATDLAANFGDSQNRMFQIESIQNQDSIWNMWFCSYVIILLRDQWLIERLSEEMGVALVGNNFSPVPSKFSFHMKKKGDSSRPEIYKH